MFVSAREVGRIPVFAMLGQSGSGKNSFLNRLLANVALKNSVLFTASSDLIVEQDHVRVQNLVELGQTSDSGCLCCGMRSGLGDALRDLFLRALGKKVPPVDRVIIETSSTDPGPLKFTLKHAPFLAQRYVFVASLLFLDAEWLVNNGAVDLNALHIGMSEYIVFLKRDLVPEQEFNLLVIAVKQLNSKAKIVLSEDMLEGLLANTLH